jgi:ABC-2 type transport system permease protein
MLPVILFELRYRLRQGTPYLFFGLLFLLGFLCYSTEAVRVTTGEAVKANSAVTIALLASLLTVLGSVMVSGLMGTTIYRDFERRTHELFFTTPLRKRDYLVGRFLGSYLVTLLVFTGVLLGMPFGAAMPWVDHARFLPFHPQPYLSAYLILVAPNLFLVGSLFFVVGALTRKLTTIYTTGVLLFVGYALASGSLQQLDNRGLAAMLDPFGLRALREVTRYWSVAEQNSNVLSLTGPLLWNRLLWMAVGVVVFVLGYRLFHFAAQPWNLASLFRRFRSQAAPVSSPDRAPALPALVFAPTLSYRAAPIYLRMVRFYLTQILRSVTFQVIVISGIAFLLIAAWNADQIFETPIYPVTRIMVTQVAGTFSLFYLILITFYAGELTWRERTIRLDQVTDALPISTGLGSLAKITAVLSLVAVLNIALLFTGVAIQLIKGYHQFEFGLYIGYLYGIVFPQIACLTLLAFFVHSLVNHKFVGHTIVILVYVLTGFLSQIGVEHNMLHLMNFPDVSLSDMNGYGPFVRPFTAYGVYWLAFGVMLTAITVKLWPRGKDSRLKTRWSRGTAGPALRAASAVSAILFLISGGYIFYNTTVLNPFRTREGDLRKQVHYERAYKARYSALPQPRVTALKIELDLFPERRQYVVRGECRLKNKTAKPVTELVVSIDRDLTIRSLKPNRPFTPGLADKEIGFYSYRLKDPLQPGQEMMLTYEAAYDRHGFSNGGQNTAIVENGTFLSNFYPRIGYQPDGEISDIVERRKRKLPPKPRMAPAADMAARQNTYLGNDSDWIQYEATVRTSPDQIAISPGYLDREWMEDGRRCFHYKMDAPIRYFVSVLSARYKVRKDSWTPKPGKPVAIEIYYHPGHEYDLDRMVKGVKRALAYCSEQYSPYQFHQLRILEFPDYASFAQSFPNTVPYSEGIGFIAKVEDRTANREGNIDYPFYVTAHEVAHQWWAHQVLGANTEGSEMLSESLAEYSALMVMEQEYGKQRMRKFLRLDLDRYLSGRSQEPEGENPLAKAQHQPYIHYQKGALVWYALRERIGEKALNAILSKFAKDKGFQDPPYTTSEDLVARLRAASPPDVQNYLTELFEKITLYTCRAVSAESVKTGPDHWHVTLRTHAEKCYSDAKGNRTPARLDDWIDVGVFGKGLPGSKEPGKPLVLERRHMTDENGTFTFEVGEEPAKAGIDPDYKLIDRSPDDHLVSVAAGQAIVGSIQK